MRLIYYNSAKAVKYLGITIECQFFTTFFLFQQLAQLSQRDRATHELLQFAKLQSGIFEPPFGGLKGKIGALSILRWKARD